MSKSVLLYCGELNGEIETIHLSGRARDVRDSVGGMFQWRARKHGWQEAVKVGWKVVTVKIEKVERCSR